MKKISILLISVILFSCSNGNKRYHIDETTSPTDTLTFLKLDMTPLNGMVYCEFGDNGFYINGKRDGEHKRWFDNGQLRDLGNYDNGKFIDYQSWFENGNQHIHNIPIKDSLYFMKVWFENGQLKQKISKKGFIREGESREWYEDGNLNNIINYKNGLFDGEWISYYKEDNGNYYMLISNYKKGRSFGETIKKDL